MSSARLACKGVASQFWAHQSKWVKSTLSHTRDCVRSTHTLTVSQVLVSQIEVAKKCVRTKSMGASMGVSVIAGLSTSAPNPAVMPALMVKYKAAAAVGVVTGLQLINIFNKPALCEGSGSLFKRLTETPIRLKGLRKEFEPWYDVEINENMTEPTPEEACTDELPVMFFLKLLQPQWLSLLFAVLTAIGSAYINIQIPMALGGLVNVVNDGFNEALLWEAGKSLLRLYCLQSGLTALYIALLAKVGEEMACSVRISLFEAILRQDMEFFDRRQTGEVVSRLTNDVQEYKSAFKQVISQGLRSSTQFLGSIVSMWMASSKLCSLTLVIVPFMVVVGSAFGHALRILSRKSSQQVGIATSVAQESVGNIRTVRAFATEDQESSLYSQECDKAAYINTYLGLGIGCFQGMSNFGINSMALMVLYYGGKMCGQGEITAGELMAFLVSTQQTQRSMSSLSLLFGAVVRGAMAGNRIFEFIKMKSTIPLVGGIRLGAVKGHIELKAVDFVYPTRPDQMVLTDLWLNAPAGKVLALCGPSGSGKSTIGSLLERFYDPVRGQIFVDGVDIRDLDPKWLRGRLIGYIGQEPILFYTSIKENIRYGRPDATDEEIMEAARKANAHNFIEEFPKGYDTIVGERGAALSGGQRQRVAIARALLKDPKVLILDEATSALDTESERLVQDALDKLLVGRTVVVIAHRLSTIKDADCIAVLKHGRVVETGTHSELVNEHGVYADLVKRQVSPDIDIE
eukprot:CFRG7834T1